MNYLLISFFAGLLTVFAPCVFTLLPVILGGSLTANSRRKAFIISLSLALSVIVFTLILKVSTALINIPGEFWNLVSGGIILTLGIITLFPELWGQMSARLGLQAGSDKLLQQAHSRKGVAGDILTGAALGPVFSSCSPTYALILATILPQDFAAGMIDLLVYALGLGVMLLLISLLGQKLIVRLKWAVNPHGTLKRALGILFIIIGLLIITGLDRQLQTYLLDHGYFDITKIEFSLLQGTAPSTSITSSSDIPVKLNVPRPYAAPEFASGNWINSSPLKMSDLKGKVVVVDFWTYSCINCIRTLPYIKQWYAKYKDLGLVIVGVHTPEFAFERIPDNVRQFAKDNMLDYPIVQDNDYKTWTAFNNQYWPAKYFIDRDGQVVHTHFGEGDYAQSEEIIQYLLGQPIHSDIGDVQVPASNLQTPETYLGYERANHFANASELKIDTTATYTPAPLLFDNFWTLGGDWDITDQSVVAMSDHAILRLNFSAKEVYLVMEADNASHITVKLNGQIIENESRGEDVDANGLVSLHSARLYRLVKLPVFKHNQELELEFEKGATLHAFTFAS